MKSIALALALHSPAPPPRAPPNRSTRSPKSTEAGRRRHGDRQPDHQGQGCWHVNDEAPSAWRSPCRPGVTVKKEKLTRADLAASTKESARFDIPVSATEAGKKSIAAEAHFVLCQEQACKPVKETRDPAIEVTPPAAAKKKKN